MRKLIASLSATLLLPVFYSGCRPIVYNSYGKQYSPEEIETLKGKTKQEVIAIMGKAQAVQTAFTDGVKTEIWSYAYLPTQTITRSSGTSGEHYMITFNESGIVISTIVQKMAGIGSR
jgi:outer membrane protein assembly factor BamE (lipoprotein component of BamABCDE complex)